MLVFWCAETGSGVEPINRLKSYFREENEEVKLLIEQLDRFNNYDISLKYSHGE
jgi:hypothetical protein